MEGHHVSCPLGVTVAAKNDYCGSIGIAGSTIVLLYYCGLHMENYCDTIVLCLFVGEN